MSDRALELIERLRLTAHPEGGHFRELYRSTSAVDPRDGRGERTALTTIYYLLRAGEFSAWHRVRSDEVWHFYSGEPLELYCAEPDFSAVRVFGLGPADGGTEPVAVVPAGSWQAARPLGSYGLVGCTVGPGFDFADFKLLRDDIVALEALRAHRSALLCFS